MKRDYPFDITMLKELLLMPRPLKCTDKRTHGGEGLLSENWKKLQGPALPSLQKPNQSSIVSAKLSSFLKKEIHRICVSLPVSSNLLVFVMETFS